MSCYEWERGTIKLSTQAFRQVLKVVQDAHNAHETGLYTRARVVYDTYQTLKDRASREAFVQTIRNGQLGDGDDRYRIWLALFQTPITDEAGHVTGYSTRETPRTPRKQDFPLANGSTLVFSEGECGARFDRKTRTVAWSVSENNHARDRAHETWLGRALFTALGRVVWTRGTGGVILGNDEYHRDSGDDYEGGGGSYATHTFGPVSKARARINRYVGSRPIRSAVGGRW